MAILDFLLGDDKVRCIGDGALRALSRRGEIVSFAGEPTVRPDAPAIGGRRRRRLGAAAALAAAAALLAAACGPQAPPSMAGSPGGVDDPSRPETVSPAPPRADLAGAKVFDAKGDEHPCPAPAATCPDSAPDRTFLDQCKLAGFQVRRCGCADLCSGNPKSRLLHFDAAGNPKDCAPPGPSCSPPPAPAAFQDACSERGHRLEMCECEWLCSGNPTR